MHFNINVTYNGQHLFATADHSITNTYELRKVYEHFQKKFPKSENYSLEVTLWELIGQTISEERIFNHGK